MPNSPDNQTTNQPVTQPATPTLRAEPPTRPHSPDVVNARSQIAHGHTINSRGPGQFPLSIDIPNASLPGSPSASTNVRDRATNEALNVPNNTTTYRDVQEAHALRPARAGWRLGRPGDTQMQDEAMLRQRNGGQQR